MGIKSLRLVAPFAAVVTLLLGGCATASIEDHPAPTNAAAPVRVAAATETVAGSSLARLEPASGVYFGANLDWGRDSAKAFNARLGRKASVFVQFATFPIGKNEQENVDGFIEQVRAEGGIALLTLEPAVPLSEITRAAAQDLANLLRGYNDSGVPVLVRFAHEMNGSWYAWGQQPKEYVAAFRLVAEELHSRTSRSAMLWAPNYGGGYPFSGGAYEARPGSPAHGVLDTDGNGLLDGRDDPYEPYYPGDDAVDWVGLTLYHWGARYPWGDNVMPEDGKFLRQLKGEYAGTAGDERGVPDFYTVYAEGHGKPLAVPETSAFFNTAAVGAPELEMKRAWWRQVLDAGTLASLPRLKMVNWFEWRKVEAEAQGKIVDWRLTARPEMVEAFLDDLPRSMLAGAGLTGNAAAAR